MSKRRKLLIIMPTAFRFGWMGATQRLFQLAKAFRQLGFEIALLAGKTTNVIMQPEIDDQFQGIIYRTRHSGSYPRLFDSFDSSRRICRLFWRMVGEDYYAEQVSCGWAKYLNIDEIIEYFGKKQFKPDIIWGVSTGYLDGPYAAQRMALTLRIPWIIELHDPPQGAGIGKDQGAIHIEFDRLLKSSIRQVVTSDAYRKNLIERFKINEKFIKTVHLTYEGKACSIVTGKRQLPLRILYAGNLGSGRNLKPLVHGIYMAINRESTLYGNIKVDLIGSGDGLLETIKLAESLKLREMFNVHGLQTKEYCEKVSFETDIFVVVQTESTSKMQIPGKLISSMKYAKPIIAIMPECEGAEILICSGLGFVHKSTDVSGIADTIIKIYHNFINDDKSVQINYDYIDGFSSESFPVKIHPIVKEIFNKDA